MSNLMKGTQVKVYGRLENTYLSYVLYHVEGAPYLQVLLRANNPVAVVQYDTQSQNFTVGNTLVAMSSGGGGEIIAIHDEVPVAANGYILYKDNGTPITAADALTETPGTGSAEASSASETLYPMFPTLDATSGTFNYHQITGIKSVSLPDFFWEMEEMDIEGLTNKQLIKLRQKYTIEIKRIAKDYYLYTVANGGDVNDQFGKFGVHSTTSPATLRTHGALKGYETGIVPTTDKGYRFLIKIGNIDATYDMWAVFYNGVITNVETALVAQKTNEETITVEGYGMVIIPKAVAFDPLTSDWSSGAVIPAYPF